MMGHWGPKCCGGKPLQSRNAPPSGSQQRKSRCPPRKHNHCCGQDNKTDDIDVGKDHSPEDEIALHYIQCNVTVRNTHPKEIMVRDVHAPQCSEAYTTIQLPASASRKRTASLCIKVDTRAGGSVLPPVCFDTFIQIKSAQLACTLAWTTSVPDSLPTMDPIYLYMVHSVGPSLGSQMALALDPTR